MPTPGGRTARVRRRRGACDQRLVRWQPTRAPSWWTDERIRVFGESGFARFFPFPFWEDRHPAPSLSPFPRARLRLHRVAAGPPVSVGSRAAGSAGCWVSARPAVFSATQQRDVASSSIISLAKGFVVVAIATPNARTGLDWTYLASHARPHRRRHLALVAACPHRRRHLALLAGRTGL